MMAVLLLVLPASAQVAFLDFTGGLDGWNTQGSVTTHDSTYSFIIGGNPFSLTPAAGESLVRITPSDSAIDGAANADTALGLTAGTLAGLLNNENGSVTNFGVLSRSFTLTAGTYSFAWAYAAEDYQPFNDGVLFAVSGGGSQQVMSLARNGSNDSDLSGPDADTLILGSYGSTAWITDTFTIAANGTYQISFASYNWNDTGMDPTFFVAGTAGSFTGTPVETSGGGPGTPNIDTAAASYAASGLGTSVNPAFEGGTLLADAASVVSDFTLSNAGGTIQAQDGVGATFSGVISNASGASTGALTIASTGTGGSVTFTGANTYTGATSVATGATLVLSGSGSLASTEVNVATGATLDNQSGGLAAGATLTNAGTVSLGADDTIAALVNSGTLNGTGHTLTAATYALNDGSVINANLGTGTVTSNGSVALNGTSAAGTVNVASGALTLGAAERLADTADVTLTGSLVLGGNETINSLSGSGATDLGAYTLTLNTGTYAGVASGTGGITKNGADALTLSGASTYTGETNLNGGTTTLSGSLASTTVNVASDATLNNQNGGLAAGATLTNAGTVNLGADDTIAALVNSGTLNGTDHTLTAATYALNDGSVINANLGTGTVTSNGSVTLNGTSAAGTVTVASGTLTLGAAERLADTADVTLTGSLVLGGNEAINALSGSGATDLGAYTLTLNTGTYAGVASGTGGITKVGSETLTLSGVNTYTGETNLNGGTTVLSGSLASTTVNVATGATLDNQNGGLAAGATLTNAGTVSLGTDDTIAALVNSGTLNGTGRTLIAATYTLNNDSVVNANLGAGVLTSNGTVALNGTSAAGTVAVESGALTLGSAGRLDAAADVTLTGSLVLGGNETINSLSGSGSTNLGGYTLTLNTGTYGGVASGTGGLTKTGAGMLTLSGANAYTGATNLNGGTTTLSGSLDSTTVNVASGATLDNQNGGLATGATLTNAGTVSLGADDAIAALVNSGMLNGTGHTLTAAIYALNDGSVINANLGTGAVTSNGSVTLNGTGAAGTVNVASGTLTLGAAERLADTADVTLTGSLVLGGNETINALSGSGATDLGAYTLTLNTGTYAGVASGTGGITKTGADTLTLSGANTYTGATNLNGGTTTLSGSLASTTVNVATGATLDNQNGGLAAGATLTNAGTVSLGADDTIAALVNSGTLNGTGHTLTAATYALNDGSVINANLGTGTVTSNGSVSLNGTSTAGTVNVASGTLTLGAAERLADTADVTLTGSLVLGGNETINSLTGSGSTNLGAYTLTLNTGTYAGVASGTGGITKNGADALTLSGANTYTGTTNLNGGTTTLSGSLASTTVNVAADAMLDNQSGGLATGATLTNAGTVSLGADDTIAALVNSGTLNGTGRTLTAATYALNDGSVVNANLGAGALTSNGTVALNGTSAAGTVAVESGMLTLGSAGRLDAAADVTLTGSLVLGGDESINSLNGSGAANLGAHTLTLNSGTYAGVASGTGGITKAGGGTLTLSGANTYTGTTNLNGGTTTLSGSLASTTVNVVSGATLDNQSGGLAAGATLTNAGTVNLGADNTIAALVNGGTLNGTGHTLTAATYTLNDGSVINANLGTGTVTSNGNVALNGTSAAGTVEVESGTLTLGSAGRLAAAANVTLSGDLVLGGHEAINGLYGSGSARLGAATLTVGEGNYAGVASGTGGLTKTGAGTLTLSGANTYTGATNLDGGTTVLSGLLDSAAVNVLAGATLDNLNGGLAAGAVLTNAGTVNLGTDDTIAALVNSGTLNGAGRTLTAATYALQDGAVVNANLGTGALTSIGAARLNGTSAAGTVDVLGGTLTLGSANRLSSGAAVTIAGGSSLLLGGNENVASFVAAGHLGGVAGSTLTAPVYDLRDGAVIDANLGHGLILSNGAVLLNGESAAEEVAVQSGSLTLGGPDRLADYSWVDINRGARLVLANGNDVIRLLTGEGDVELRNGSVLVVHSGTYTGSASSTGALLKDAAPVLTLGGQNTYEAGTIVRNGELEVTPTGQLTSDVTVENTALFRVNGLISGAVTIQAGGRLLGSGRIAGNTRNDGTTAPGNSPGVLTFAQNYTEAGRLSIEIDGRAGAGAAGGHDQIQVAGRVVIEPGSTLELTRSVNNGFEPAAGERFLVVRAAGGIEGRFSYLDRSAFSTLLFFDHGTGYVYGTGVAEGGDVTLSAGATPNERAILGSLMGSAITSDDSGQLSFFDSRSGQGALFNALLAMPSWSDALKVMSPDAYAGLTDYALQVSRNYGRDAARLPALGVTGGWRISAGHTGYRVNTLNAANEMNYTLRSRGASFGLSKEVGRGFVFGLFHHEDSGDVAASRARFDVDGRSTGAHAAYTPAVAGGRITLGAGVAFADYTFAGDRATFLGRATARTKARADDYWVDARVELLRRGRLELVAITGLASTEARVDGFTENGPADAQRIVRMSDRLLIGDFGFEAGVRLSKRAYFSTQATFVANFRDGSRDVDAEFSGATGRYRVTAPGLDEDTLRLGGNISYEINRRLVASGYYAANVTAGTQVSRSYGVTLRVRF